MGSLSLSTGPVAYSHTDYPLLQPMPCPGDNKVLPWRDNANRATAMPNHARSHGKRIPPIFQGKHSRPFTSNTPKRRNISREPRIGSTVVCLFGRGRIVEIRPNEKQVVVCLSTWPPRANPSSFSSHSSRVTCYLAASAVTVVQPNSLHEMSVLINVDFGQGLKEQAAKALTVKDYAAAVQMYARTLFAVDAVQYMRHKSVSNNEVRLDLLILVISCSNKFATCWSKIEQADAGSLDSLKVQGGDIHTLRARIAYSRIFGGWRAEHFLVTARAFAAQPNGTQQVIKNLEKAAGVIDKHTDAEHATQPSLGVTVQRLLLYGKEIKKLLVAYNVHLRVEETAMQEQAHVVHHALLLLAEADSCVEEMKEDEPPLNVTNATAMTQNAVVINEKEERMNDMSSSPLLLESRVNMQNTEIIGPSHILTNRDIPSPKGDEDLTCTEALVAGSSPRDVRDARVFEHEITNRTDTFHRGKPLELRSTPISRREATLDRTTSHTICNIEDVKATVPVPTTIPDNATVKYERPGKIKRRLLFSTTAPDVHEFKRENPRYTVSVDDIQAFREDGVLVEQVIVTEKSQDAGKLKKRVSFSSTPPEVQEFKRDSPRYTVKVEDIQALRAEESVSATTMTFEVPKAKKRVSFSSAQPDVRQIKPERPKYTVKVDDTDLVRSATCRDSRRDSRKCTVNVEEIRAIRKSSFTNVESASQEDGNDSGSKESESEALSTFSISTGPADFSDLLKLELNVDASNDNDKYQDNETNRKKCYLNSVFAMGFIFTAMALNSSLKRN